MPNSYEDQQREVLSSSSETTMMIPIIDNSSTNNNDGDDESSSPSNKNNRWVLVELNGELLVPTQLPSKEEAKTILGGEDRVELGKLEMTANNVPMMTLGSHQLKGKIEKLKEPFSVMEKEYDENQSLKAYKIIGTVHEKFIFNQYPKVIMR